MQANAKIYTLFYNYKMKIIFTSRLVRYRKLLTVLIVNDFLQVTSNCMFTAIFA